MKFMLFHLMPYTYLDLNYTDKHESAWVTLPGTYFDREKGHELYMRFMDELELGDQMGFDAIGVNEHHQNAYGLMPVPAVIAGALSRRIKGKLAVLGRALPLLNNPLVVAEEFAMLDQITGGRLIAGFVRGIGGEYHSWGANPTESHERFLEAHDLIVRAWTEPGPFAFEGKYYDFDYVNTWPRPYQTPHPPVWIPSTGSSETVAFAAQKKYTYLQTYSPVASVRRSLEQYRAEAQKSGYTAAPEQMGWMAPIYVAETDEQACAEAKPHIEAFANKFLRKPFEMRLPPGYVSMKSIRGVMQAKASQTVDRTFEEILAGGSVVCGSVETVRKTLLERQRDMGHGWQLCLMQFGTLPSNLTRKNMELFATQVMPYLREHAGSEEKVFART
jgi:alkanesulfonate monooxygenase SsuD/methylene tetrahydromethanopterin reductase-like flavin-dependent oxidoreductase (luciferase family)